MATAYAALVSLLNDLDLIPNHPTHSFSFDNNQIDSLLQKVCFLIDFMETCDYHGASEAEALEKKIAAAAHAAGDVILSHVADQIRSRSTLRDKTRPSRFLLDLQKAIEDMEYVKRKAINFQKVQSPLSSLSAATPSTPLNSQKNTMVGFDKVLYQLLDLLTGEAGERVIFIVAMGGAGKTTLARNAFQHKLVAEHFDICLWATISKKYEVEGILNQLLGSKSTRGSVDMLGERLYKSLYRRRYLIVLDDMWSFEAWDEIKFYFPQYEDNKSRIVVTSRQSHLVDKLSSSQCFPLDLLDKDNSWDLFCKKVFGDQKGCPPELEEVGHKIVKKCRGLPLAIVVVGGHLRNSFRTQEYWENVAKHMDSILSSDVNEPCLDILLLSYSCLPVHLKPCFLYMGILNEDQRIDASSLIKLWIGEGFIKPSKTQSLEEIAEGYLKDLVDRNLILSYRRDLKGKIMSCELHDIVRELCLRICGKEKFLCVLDTREAVHMERRVVFPISKLYYHGRPHIRSLRVLNEVDGDFLEEGCHQVNLRHLGCIPAFNISPSISLLWSLQTLILVSQAKVPHEFWEMLQLRHFESNGTICLPDPLPNDSGRLVQGNLQTLLGVDNLRLSEVVCKRISQIKELRIEYSDLESLCDATSSLYCPQNISLLHKLESLEIAIRTTKRVVFETGVHDEKQQKKVYEAVSSFMGIHSRIQSVSLDDKSGKVTVEGEVDTVELVEKLKKTFHDELVMVESVKEFSMWPGFVPSFRFPDSLKHLSIVKSCLSWEELSMMAGSLPLLESLYLGRNAVIGSQWNPIEGHFDHLKFLAIHVCMDLVNFNVDSSHFPALKFLDLEFLPNLDELPSSIGELSSLQCISIRRCSVMLAMSAMRILVEQEQDYGNEGLHFHISLWGEEKKSFQKEMEKEGLKSNNLYL